MINSVSSSSNLAFAARAPKIISMSPKATAQTVKKIADSLGIDIAIAQNRLRMAQYTKGINTSNPELMKRAIAGEFEVQQAIKPGTYLYKQKNYARSERAPLGTQYADSRLKRTNWVGRTFFSA